MRHLERTQNCSVKWLHEQYDRGLYKLNKIDIDFQAADVFTKPFTDGKKWKDVCQNVLVPDPKTFWDERNDHVDTEEPSGDNQEQKGLIAPAVQGLLPGAGGSALGESQGHSELQDT
eukprot:301949-Alexandrium_andersonii.AAC.1